MNINDETLSAFLDQELAEEQMDEVRDAIAANPSLSERLAELARVDAMVKQHATAVDVLPVPPAIAEMLQIGAFDSPPQDPSADWVEPAAVLPAQNVIPLPLWRRGHNWLSRHAALAAGLMLVIGFAAGTVTFPPGTDSDGFNTLATHLEQYPSGEPVTLAPNTQIQTRFTFLDTQGHPCRQYQLHSAQGVTENIACRQQGVWHLQAMVRVPEVPQNGQYTPASGFALLDGVLDGIMTRGPLSLEEEARLIGDKWER